MNDRKTDDPSYDGFLSHNSQDRAFVEKVGDWLAREHGLNLFLDEWYLLPGDVWQEELERALDNSRAVVVFIGSTGIGPWHNEEMRSAIEQSVRDRTFRIIPVLLPGVAGDNRGAVPLFLRGRQWIQFRNDWYEPDRLELLARGIRGERQVAPSAQHFTARLAPPAAIDLRPARLENDKILEPKNILDSPRPATLRDISGAILPLLDINRPMAAAMAFY